MVANLYKLFFTFSLAKANCKNYRREIEISRRDFEFQNLDG